MTTIAELGVQIRTNGVREAARDLDKFEQSSGKAEKSVNQLAATAKRAFAAFLATGGVALATREWIRQSDVWAQMRGRLQLVMESHNGLVKAQKELFLISQRTGSSLEATYDLYTKLAQSSDALRGNQEKLVKVTDLVSKSLALSGADAASASAVIRQFSQALAAGALRGDEFVSVMEGAPRLARAIADGLGVPIGKLREFASEGKLTAEIVTTALTRSGKAIDAEFSKLPLTVGRSAQAVKNSLLQLIGETDTAAGATRGLAQEVKRLADVLGDPRTREAFAGVASGVAKITAEMVESTSVMARYFQNLNNIFSISDKLRRNAPVGEFTDREMEIRMSTLQARIQKARKAGDAAELQMLIDERTRLQRENTRRIRLELGEQGNLTSKPGEGRWANVRGSDWDPNSAAPILLPETETKGRKSRRAEISDEQREMERLQETYTRLTGSMHEQIELFGQTGEAARIRYQTEHGELQKLTELQKQTLQEQAEWLDWREEMADIESVWADVAAESTQRALDNMRLMQEEAERTKSAFVDAFRYEATDALTDFVTGAKSAKEAATDFFDNMAEMITRMIAEQWMQQLFGGFGTTGAGTKGGDWLGQLFGLFSGGWAGGGFGYASGGFTGAGSKNEVAGLVHRGEYVINADAVNSLPRAYLDSLNRGKVPATPAQNYGPPVVHQVIQVQGVVDNRTSQQIARESGRSIATAIRRNG